jgi:hypothetical protein
MKVLVPHIIENYIILGLKPMVLGIPHLKKHPRYGDLIQPWDAQIRDRIAT